MARASRIQHISIPRPPGTDKVPRAFYGDLLGLEEIPVPESIQYLDLIWYRLGDMELHLFAQDPLDSPSDRHFCLVVDDVDGIRTKLVEAGYEPWDTAPIPGRPRFFCRDPYNNTIEFTTIEGDYLELQKNGSDE